MMTDSGPQDWKATARNRLRAFTGATMSIDSVVAKMQCQSTETAKHSWGASVHKVRLGAVYGKEGEAKDFSDATPSGECWMQISDGRPAADFFKPGKNYYVTFTEAPA